MPSPEELDLKLKICRFLDRPAVRARFIEKATEWGLGRQLENQERDKFQQHRAQAVDRFLNSTGQKPGQKLPTRSRIDEALPIELRESQVPSIKRLFPLGGRDLSLLECYACLAIVHDALTEPSKRPPISETPASTTAESHPWLRCDVQRYSVDAATMLEVQIAVYSQFGATPSDVVVLRDALERVRQDLPPLPKEDPIAVDPKIAASKSDQLNGPGEPDGPIIGGFRYQGVNYYGKLVGIPRKLVEYLWNKRHAGASFDDVARIVWGDSQGNGDKVKEKFRGPQSVATSFSQTEVSR